MKGQAALEFISTYGWAFVIIIIMVAAMAKLNVLNPSEFIPDICLSDQQMPCVEQYMSVSAQTIQARFVNNIGKPVSFQDFSSSTHFLNTSTIEPSCVPSAVTLNIANSGEENLLDSGVTSTLPHGQDAIVTISCPPNSFNSEEFIRVSTKLPYQESGGSLIKIFELSISGTAQ